MPEMTDERGKALSTVLWSAGIAAAVAAVIALSLLPASGRAPARDRAPGGDWAPAGVQPVEGSAAGMDAAAAAWGAFQPVEKLVVRAEDVVELVGLMTAGTGTDNETPGAEPLPVHYVWCEDDGHSESNLEEEEEPEAGEEDERVPAPADDAAPGAGVPEPDAPDDGWPPPAEPDEVDDPFELDDLAGDEPRAPLLPFEQRVHRDRGPAPTELPAGGGLPEPVAPPLPGPAGTGPDPPAQRHEAVFALSVPRAGTYYPWARVWWQDSCGDSLYVLLEREGVAQEYVLQDGTHKSWHWLPMTGPAGMTLTQGDYRLTVRNREDGARLSRILLAPKDFRTYKPETPEG